MTAQKGAVKVEKTHILTNDVIKIVSAPLMHQEETVMEVRKSKVKVLLPTLRFALVATVDKQHVDVLVTREPGEKAKQV